MINKLLWLALAGAFGTLARYGLVELVQRVHGVSFPWGTLVVNILGCFVVGLLWVLFENRWPVSPEIRWLVLVGFMGAFTTFSAFMFETGELARTASWMHAAANVGLQNGVGFAALFIGISVGKYL